MVCRLGYFGCADSGLVLVGVVSAVRYGTIGYGLVQLAMLRARTQWGRGKCQRCKQSHRLACFG